LVTEFFFTCAWKFLQSLKLGQLDLEKIIGIEKQARKVRKSIMYFLNLSGIHKNPSVQRPDYFSILDLLLT
jgi:hypothetical protein